MLGFVIGDNNLVTGFRLVGVQGKEVASVSEAQEALRQVLTQSDIAIVVISDEYSSQMQPQIEQARMKSVKPVIVEIPSSKSPPGKDKFSSYINKVLGFKLS